MDCKLGRKTSIEEEPQTLSLDQLRYAREEALYVMNTKTLEEAISIFTEGLQPVLCTRQGNMNVDFSGDADDDRLDCRAGAVDQLLPGLRDIVTAPF